MTTLYRQNVSNFLSCSDVSLKRYAQQNPSNNNDGLTSWIGDTARSLALRSAMPFAIDDAVDTTTAADNLNNVNNKVSVKKKKAKMKNPTLVSADDVVRSLPSNWSDFICMTCGTFLFPPVIMPTTTTTTAANNEERGKKDNDVKNNTQSSSQTIPLILPSNIYLRPLKRGRTRRRRASRAKAKQLANHTLSLVQRRGTSNTTNSQLCIDALVKEKMQQIASSYRLGDGRAKNCLVLCCTFCGTKKKRKGCGVVSEKKKISKSGEGGGKAVAVGGAFNNNATARKNKRESQQPETKGKVEKKKNVTSQIRDNSDFISFGSMNGDGNEKKGQQAHVKKHEQDNNDSERFTSPLLGGKKKKKKQKKVETKKGELMNFLSSLND